MYEWYPAAYMQYTQRYTMPVQGVANCNHDVEACSVILRGVFVDRFEARPVLARERKVKGTKFTRKRRVGGGGCGKGMKGTRQGARECVMLMSARAFFVSHRQ